MLRVPLFRSPLAKGLLLGSQPLSPYSDPFVFRQHFSCSANPILFKQPSLIEFGNLRFRSDLSYPLRSLRLEYSSMASASSSDAKSVYDFVVKDARGNDVDLSQYKGKVLLIVNVASQCGLTNSNYTELSELYTKYKDQGLEILAFPCNQFGAQEPGSNEQIVEFACTRFKAEFPIFDKVDVNGDKAAPIYKFLKSSKGSLFGDGIKWNFTKFLVDKNGSVVERYAPTTSPSSIERVAMARALARSVLLRGHDSLSDWSYIKVVLSSARPPPIGPLGAAPDFSSIYERGKSSRTSAADAEVDRREALRAESVVIGVEQPGIFICDSPLPAAPRVELSKSQEKRPAIKPDDDGESSDDQPI
ncbi:hypothetical protein V2J09_004918 [Rumex salicifolius]